MPDGITLHLDTARFNARLREFVTAVERGADRVVFATAVEVLGDTQVDWPVDSGISRAGWWGPKKIREAEYQIGNPFRRSLVIEYGGWPNPGPKTERRAGERLTGGFQINPGVYARQSPSAPLRRALAKNYGRMTQELQKLHREQWGR